MKFKNLVTILAIASSPYGYSASKLELASSKTTDQITIDGNIESAWHKAKSLTVTVNELPYEPDNGYKGQKSADVEIRSLHDEKYLYMLFSWNDKTHDLQRFPWQKQKDGTWIQRKNLDSTIHENTWYEDKLAVFWNINEKGFIKKGCDKSCHMTEDGKIDGIADDSAGRHYTKKNEKIDEWQWKATRINANYQIDDGYVDDEKNTNKKWGRHPDKGDGGYYNNINEEKNGPAFQSNVNPQKFWIEEKNKQPFFDNFNPGDFIAGIVTQPFTGSRGDVTTRGFWDGKKWHLEIKRKLQTDDKVYDLQFDDLNKTYHLGVTVFDNSQINHLYHKKSIAMTFQ